MVGKYAKASALAGNGILAKIAFMQKAQPLYLIPIRVVYRLFQGNTPVKQIDSSLANVCSGRFCPAK